MYIQCMCITVDIYIYIYINGKSFECLKQNIIHI